MKNYALLLLFCLSGCHRQSPAPVGPVFDVPSLLGKTATQVEKQLGAPSQIAPDKKVWKRDDVALTMKFSPPSDLVTEFSLDAQGEPLADALRDDFLKSGHLTAEGDDRYQLAFTEAPDKVFYFTGARIDLPQTHNAEFRVTGPEVLVSVTYAMMAEGASGLGDNILTLPPWNLESKANIGQRLVFSVAAMTKPGQAPPKQAFKLQILVDGRVLKEASGVASAKCEAQL